MQWDGDFSRLESTTWSWWPRFVPDGTACSLGSNWLDWTEELKRLVRNKLDPLKRSGHVSTDSADCKPQSSGLLAAVVREVASDRFQVCGT